MATYLSPPRILISVDPATPDNWRNSPYIEQIQHWSQQGAIQVQVGPRTYAVDERGIHDLGEDTPDSVVLILEQQTPLGVRYRLERQPR